MMGLLLLKPQEVSVCSCRGSSVQLSSPSKNILKTELLTYGSLSLGTTLCSPSTAPRESSGRRVICLFWKRKYCQSWKHIVLYCTEQEGTAGVMVMDKGTCGPILIGRGLGRVIEHIAKERRDEGGGGLAPYALIVTESYHFIFVLDVVLLLFFGLLMVQLNEEKVNACSDCSAHHGPGHRDPPPAASGSAERIHTQQYKLHVPSCLTLDDLRQVQRKIRALGHCGCSGPSLRDKGLRSRPDAHA
ncbi:hypothetical protein EYF80_002220 [Liparis tanakae]|uniref:Uncharacterized protein n=1 Tax=Liparis tanakae TaxID=230148 RepID=A0A4Z2JCJ9_9TELE|nr:hypothetical protein EYF80_002220 [Liparis tanakae]